MNTPSISTHLSRAVVLGLAALLFYSTPARATTNVYGVHPVGYLNMMLVPGFSLIGNPFIASDNRISALFSNIPNLPDGFAIFLLSAAGYEKVSFNAAALQFEPEELASRLLLPGEGVWVLNPSQSPILVTFTGTVPQGILSKSIPAGFSLVSSMVLRQAAPDEMSFPGEPGDIIYFFDEEIQNFHLSVFDDLDDAWVPPLRKVHAGEAFVVRKVRASDWVQRFSIDGFAGQAVASQIGASSEQAFAWSERPPHLSQ